jgi:hypothetical protein
MKTNIQLTKILLFFTGVLFLCMVIDFLALTDINHEYVSKLVITKFSPSASNTLPDFTNNSLEWSIVQISFFIKFLIAAIAFLLLISLRKNLPKVE